MEKYVITQSEEGLPKVLSRRCNLQSDPTGSSNRRAPGCAQPSGKLYILLLNGDTLGVNGAEVRIVEEADEESFRSLLQRLDSLTLPSVRSALGRHVLADFPDLTPPISFSRNKIASFWSSHQSLKRRSKQQELS